MDRKRARKREMDRICQQRKRKRDRENLQRLEERMQLLQQDKQDMLIADMMRERDQNEESNMRHRKRLLQISGLIRADLADLGHLEGPVNTECRADAPLSPQKIISTAATEYVYPGEVASECPSEQAPSLSSGELDVLDALVSEMLIPRAECGTGEWPQHHADGIAGACHDIPSAPGVVADAGHHSMRWKQAERLISQIMPSMPASDKADDELDMHIIITAISRSWAQFSQAVLVDARWSCLRELDEKYFAPNYSNVERLAVLAIASQVFKVNASISCL